MVILLVIVSLVLLGGLRLLLPRAGADLRFPRAVAAVLGAPLSGGRTRVERSEGAARRGEPAAGGQAEPGAGGHAEPGSGAATASRPSGRDDVGFDVELAVRERLYGRRPDRG